MNRHSTDYYRENRRTKNIKYQCPECDYCTYDSKITLTNHINARHKDEKSKPFQCSECTRGFAQKAHLVRHLKCEHNIQDPKLTNISTCLYIITLTDIFPRSTKTKARRRYYMNHPILKGRDIYKKKHQYLPNTFLKNHDIHYDVKQNFITIQKIVLKKGIVLRIRPNIIVRL